MFEEKFFDRFIFIIPACIAAVAVYFSYCLVESDMNMEINTATYAQVLEMNGKSPSVKKVVDKALEDGKISVREYNEIYRVADDCDKRKIIEQL